MLESHTHSFHAWIDKRVPYGRDQVIAIATPLHCACGARMVTSIEGFHDEVNLAGDAEYFTARCAVCNPTAPSQSATQSPTTSVSDDLPEKPAGQTP